MRRGGRMDAKLKRRGEENSQISSPHSSSPLKIPYAFLPFPIQPRIEHLNAPPQQNLDSSKNCLLSNLFIF